MRGVGSSNLPVPTIVFPLFLRYFVSSFFLAAASHFPNYDVIVTLSSDLTALRFACCRTWLYCSSISRLAASWARPAAYKSLTASLHGKIILPFSTAVKLLPKSAAELASFFPVLRCHGRNL